MTHYVDSLDRSARKPTKIEITPEMIAAGAEIIDYWAKDVREGWALVTDVALLVFDVMISRQSPSSLREALSCDKI